MRVDAVVWVLLAQALLCASECNWVTMPCERIQSPSVFFVGQLAKVVREVPRPPEVRDQRIHFYEFRVRVKESLHGIAEAPADQFMVLPHYARMNTDTLFHMLRKADGGLEFPDCGVSGELEGKRASRFSLDMVAYLRALRDGAPDEGSVTIMLKPFMTPDTTVRVEDAKITLEFGNERREFVTNGPVAQVNRLRPGTYRLTASKPGFVEAEEPETAKQLIVSPRSCFSRWVSLVPAPR